MYSSFHPMGVFVEYPLGKGLNSFEKSAISKSQNQSKTTDGGRHEGESATHQSKMIPAGGKEADEPMIVSESAPVPFSPAQSTSMFQRVKSANMYSSSRYASLKSTNFASNAQKSRGTSENDTKLS